MALVDVVFGLWQILTLNVQLVGYEPDEETRERMEQRAEMLKREMTRLWQEVEERSREQRNQEQSNFAWVSLLLSALQHWQFWVVAGVLVLLFGLCWGLRKWSCEPQREEESTVNNVAKKKHGEENNDANEAEEGNDNANEAQEQNNDPNEDKEGNDNANEGQEQNDDPNEDEEGNDDANEAQEENDDANEDEEGNDNANEAQEQNDDPNEDEEGNDDANEAQEENDDANEPEEENDNGNEDEEENDDANEDEEENDGEDQEENDDANEDEEENDGEDQEENDDANEDEEENDDANEDEEENDDANDPGRFFEEDAQRPDQNRDRDCKSVRGLMEIFIAVYHHFFSNTCFPVLEKAIEVGSAFEGWSPREEDITYRLLLPLKAPRGHVFHLEPGPLWPMRNFRIRVELVCTCEMAQPAGQTRCFLHDAEQEQRWNEGPNILEDLCTDSYLDVQKTARYFQMFVRRSWKVLPVSAAHRLTMLPSDRSCKFCVTQRRGKRILIELMFGVQEGTSDIFVSSQYTEAAYTPSTVWPESYAVAEIKFFKHIASRAQPDTYHLRCLQICARCLLGRDFSTYTLKTVMMHMLTTIPLSNWRRRPFWEWLNDFMQYLQSCLKERRLIHFFIGNANVPEEINVPLELQMAEPVNLFQHLTQNPYASQHAQREFEELGNRIRRMVLHRH